MEKAPYKILGACNPEFANRALEAEPGIGPLLPCNVVVRQVEDDVVVSFVDPVAVLGMVQRKEVEELGGQVRERLLRVREAMAA